MYVRSRSEQRYRNYRSTQKNALYQEKLEEKGVCYFDNDGYKREKYLQMQSCQTCHSIKSKNTLIIAENQMIRKQKQLIKIEMQHVVNQKNTLQVKLKSAHQQIQYLQNIIQQKNIKKTVQNTKKQFNNLDLHKKISQLQIENRQKDLLLNQCQFALVDIKKQMKIYQEQLYGAFRTPLKQRNTSSANILASQPNSNIINTPIQVLYDNKQQRMLKESSIEKKDEQEPRNKIQHVRMNKHRLLSSSEKRK